MTNAYTSSCLSIFREKMYLCYYMDDYDKNSSVYVSSDVRVYCSLLLCLSFMVCISYGKKKCLENAEEFQHHWCHILEKIGSSRLRISQ